MTAANETAGPGRRSASRAFGSGRSCRPDIVPDGVDDDRPRDGNGIGFFMLIMTAIVGCVASGFRPGGMARTMTGVAIMQVLLGIAIATAPITERVPGASLRILAFSAAFAGLWLISAAAFRVAGLARTQP